jgi:hypothetical protein
MILQEPWPAGKTINKNSPYGWRVHPISGKRKFHQGVDVAGSFPVTAAADGVVAHIGWSASGGGHVVGIDHGSVWTFYYHGAEATKLRKGSRVRAGEFIYPSGTTGASTGVHLHFEVRKSKRWGNTADPVPYLAGGAPVASQRVSGRLDKTTWKQWQVALQPYGYTGRIDGIPGKMTYAAMQKWAGVKADGIIGPNTRRAVQVKLGVKPDGKWGKLTISELQRQLNTGKI